MKISALPSGNYRIQPMIRGKRYSLTFDHKPSKADIQEAIADVLSKTVEKPANERTFGESVKAYVELKRDRLSPATRREYLKMENSVTEAFWSKAIGKIMQDDVDKEVALWLKDRKAYKTIKNRFGMINTIMQKYDSRLFKGDMLPEKPQSAEPYIPTKDEVKKILDYIETNNPTYYAPIALACYGLRRGEIFALEPSDISKDNVAHITKALSKNEDRQWEIKPPKESYSVRDVPISPKLATFIRKQGFVYKGGENNVTRALHDAQRALGVKQFSLHKLRHYFVSELWQAHVPVPDIKKLGGYAKASEVMEIIYTHSRIDTDKERRQQIMDTFSSALF